MLIAWYKPIVFYYHHTNLTDTNLTDKTQPWPGRAAGQGSESIKSISLFYLDITGQFWGHTLAERTLDLIKG